MKNVASGKQGYSVGYFAGTKETVMFAKYLCTSAGFHLSVLGGMLNHPLLVHMTGM